MIGGYCLDLKYVYRTIRFIIVIGAVMLGILAFYYLSKVTYPFLIGIIIAFIMNPLVNLLENKVRMPRVLAVFISLVLIIAVFAGLVTLLIARRQVGS